MELESLPYIDDPPSETERKILDSLIEDQIAQDNNDNHNEIHPRVAELALNQEFWSNTLIGKLAGEAGVEEEKKKEKEDGIDLSRYSLKSSACQDDAKKLQLAYTLLEYTHGRDQSLHQLGQGGRNQWLIANDQVETQLLAPLEAEIGNLDNQIHLVNGQRKNQQLQVKDKLHYLESRWRSALDSLLQVNLANLQLEHQLHSS